MYLIIYDMCMSDEKKAKPKKGFANMLDILNKYDVAEPKIKRISREFQDYAYRLAVDLDDVAHVPIYMRLVKNTDRGLIETARSFVKDSVNAKSKGKLFMWKLKQLRTFKKVE
jgi:hypothetical protein